MKISGCYKYGLILSEVTLSDSRKVDFVLFHFCVVYDVVV